MTMTHEQLHTHGRDELAMLRAECDKWHKAYDRVWEERMRFADRAIELEKENKELKDSQRWRKCSEEMPTADNGYVLVLWEDGVPDIGYIGAEDDVIETIRDRGEGHSIEYWMPLPKAPEDK